MVGRAAAPQQRVGLIGEVVLQHLHQARFANPGLAAQQDHLAQAILDLRPAVQQQGDFGLPPHQWGEALGAGHIQATLRPALPQHTIHPEGRVHALERRGTQIVADKVALYEVMHGSADDHGIGGR
jgi:hypothetical protein